MPFLDSMRIFYHFFCQMVVGMGLCLIAMEILHLAFFINHRISHANTIRLTHNEPKSNQKLFFHFDLKKKKYTRANERAKR